MRNDTPFLPAFRACLAPMGPRRAAQHLRQTTLSQLQERLCDLFPPALLEPQKSGSHSRRRLWSLRLTLECFLWQVLKPKTACREVVRQVQTLCRLAGRAVPDDGDSAYVQARARLPKERLSEGLRATAQAADQRAGAGGQLRGRRVQVVDGSSVQLADTAAHQRAYPQPSTQKAGCGFPVLKFLALMSLCSGAIKDLVLGNLHSHDLRLLRQLWDRLVKGDILLGDRAFGEYTTLAALPARGVDVVARLHGARKVDFRQAAQRLGKNDGRFTWRKPAQRSEILTAEEWAQLPAEITVRIVRFPARLRGHGRQQVTLVTTLLVAEQYPAAELAALYQRRWGMELRLRDLKTTMGMAELRCKSPALAEKELLAYLVAHNLLRCVMATTVGRYGTVLERISFKGAMDALRQYSEALGKARNRQLRDALWEDLLANLARDLVRHRPDRTEPRAVKRRPKPYPLLTQPRGRYKEIPHRNRYRRVAARKQAKLN